MPPATRLRHHKNKPEYSALVPAVAEASQILLTLAQEPSGKMTLTQICRAVGIHKSKGYSILNTLQHFAFIQRDAHSKLYALGPGLLFLSRSVLTNLDLREAIAPVLRQLALETNSTTFFGIISDQHVFVVAKDEGSQDIGVTIRLGHRFPLAWGAHGKSIVANLPEADRKKVLERERLYFHGDVKCFDPERLEREITACRAKGFAEDLGEMKIGIHAVAAPVFGLRGKLIGSLAIVGTFPKEMVKRYGAKVAQAARQFSESMKGSHGLFDRFSLNGNGDVLDETRAQKED